MNFIDILLVVMATLVVILWVIQPRPSKEQYFHVFDVEWKSSRTMRAELNEVMGINLDSPYTFLREVNPYPQFRKFEREGFLRYEYRTGEGPGYYLTSKGTHEKSKLFSKG